MAKKNSADRAAAKAKLAEERARQAAVERRRKLAFVTVGVVAFVASAAAVVVGVMNEDGGAEGPTPAVAAGVPASDDGGIVIGPDEAEAAESGIPTVDVYEDFQCPACATFEATSGPTLLKLAGEDAARVVYHPINLIGAQLSGSVPRSSSLRSASAFACATTESLDKGMDFHSIAFANQTQEGQGITDELLLNWGREAGLTSDTFTQCVQDQTYVGWAERVDAASGDRNITGTPTVLVNGKELTRQPNQYTPEGLEAAGAAATTKK